MPSFLQDYGLSRRQWGGTREELISTKANITSFGVLGAAFGAIVALAITDRIGRLRTWQTFMAIWMSGFFITTFASGYLGLLLFSRLLSGLGAGGLTVVSPLYLTEIARSKNRGMVVSVYMVLLLSFLTFGKSSKKSIQVCASRVSRLVLVADIEYYNRLFHQLWRQKIPASD